MRYEYVGLECRQRGGKMCGHVIELPASQCQDIGKTRACPEGGCKGRVTRVISTSVTLVTKHAPQDVGHGQGYVAKVNGQDIAFTFQEHRHTDPKYQRNLAALGGADGITSDGLGKAYYSEKHNRMCVDVRSNVEDPLGKLQRAMDGQPKETRKVNQPYKVRPKKRDQRVSSWKSRR